MRCCSSAQSSYSRAAAETRAANTNRRLLNRAAGSMPTGARVDVQITSIPYLQYYITSSTAAGHHARTMGPANALRRVMARPSRMSFPQHSQRRTFLGLQRTPPPSSRMMGALVAQGLAVVLLADLGFATLTNQTTTVRSVAQSAGYWLDPPEFEKVHGKK